MSAERSNNLHEQWHAINFCVKLKKTVTEMKEMLNATYNGSAVSKTSVYHWYNKFKSGRKIQNW